MLIERTRKEGLLRAGRGGRRQWPKAKGRRGWEKRGKRGAAKKMSLLQHKSALGVSLHCVQVRTLTYASAKAPRAPLNHTRSRDRQNAEKNGKGRN